MAQETGSSVDYSMQFQNPLDQSQSTRLEYDGSNDRKSPSVAPSRPSSRFGHYHRLEGNEAPILAPLGRFGDVFHGAAIRRPRDASRVPHHHLVIKRLNWFSRSILKSRKGSPFINK